NDPIDGRDPSGLCSDSPDDGTSSGSGDKEKNAARHAAYVKCVVLSAEALLAEQGMTLDEAFANAENNFGGDMFCDASGCEQGYSGQMEAYGTNGRGRFDGDVEGEVACWFAPHGLFISTEWRRN